MSENGMKNTNQNETEVLNTRAVFDHDEDDNTTLKGTSGIRIALHAVVIVILLLGILGIVSKKITIPVGAGLLILTSCWNAVAYIKDGRKKQGIFTIVICAILVVMLAVYFLLQSDLIK